MLKQMRDSFHHLKWVLAAVIAAFVIGFVYVDMGLGGASQSRQATTSYAARVNGETITTQDFTRAVKNMEDNYKRLYGQQFTPEMAESMGLNHQVLDSLVDQRLLLQQAERLHLQATPEEVQKKILSIPTLNPDGKFVGPELYARFVNMVGFANAADFEDELAREITLEKMESALANSVVISPKAAEAEYRRNTENAKIRYVFYPASRETPTITVSPAEVDAYYKAHQDKYSHTEQRELKYLIADVARIRSQIVPTEAEIKGRYDTTKEDFKSQEAAHVFHILVKVEPGATPQVEAAAKAKADDLVKQLRAGADFGKLARDNSQDPGSAANGGDMGFVEKGQTVEAFEGAIFSAPINTVVDPVRSPEYGFHIIKVTERRPAGYRTLDEVRAQISSQIANQKAQDQAREEMTRTSARMKEKKPANANEFVTFASDKVTSNDTQWFQKGQSVPGLGYNQQLAAWTFAGKLNDLSDVVGTQRGPAVAMISGIRPAGVSPLDEVRARVETDARTAKAIEAAKQRLATAMAGAPNVDAVAQKVGLTAAETTVNRQGNIPTIQGDTSALTDAAINSPVGALKGPVVAGEGAAVFQVAEQKKVDPAEIAKNRPAFLDAMRQREARTLRASLLQRLRKDADIKINDTLVQPASRNPQQQQQQSNG
jgi:peptidyl-prolyl cis-trans isomerase D